MSLIRVATEAMYISIDKRLDTDRQSVSIHLNDFLTSEWENL